MNFNYYLTDKSHLRDTMVHEILFRRSDHKGGEAAIRWYDLDFPGRTLARGRKPAPVPRLEVFSDAWVMLPDLSPLLAFLSQNPGSRQQLTPESVLEFMRGQGWTRGHAAPPKKD